MEYAKIKFENIKYNNKRFSHICRVCLIQLLSYKKFLIEKSELIRQTDKNTSDKIFDCDFLINPIGLESLLVKEALYYVECLLQNCKKLKNIISDDNICVCKIKNMRNLVSDMIDRVGNLTMLVISIETGLNIYITPIPSISNSDATEVFLNDMNQKRSVIYKEKNNK